jgi:GNAT superfamily N-acetyltransferase
MFESIDDTAVAGSLLEAASDWLRKRGRTWMLGPIDYSNNYPCGLLVDGFSTPPRYMMNHHPPYYAELMRSCGLRKSKDLYAWWFVDQNDILAKWRRLAERAARRDAVTVRTFRRSDFDQEVRRCLEVYHGTQKDSWAYTRLTDAEFEFMARRMARFGISDQVLLAEVDGKPVGFAITVPDINEAVKPLNGRLTRFGLPIGLLRLAYGIRRVKTARMMVLCVLDGYRRRGIGELLVLHTLEYGKHTIGYTGAELGWTVEGNDAIDRVLQRVGAERYKTYRVYEMTIA